MTFKISSLLSWIEFDRRGGSNSSIIEYMRPRISVVWEINEYQMKFFFRLTHVCLLDNQQFSF